LSAPAAFTQLVLPKASYHPSDNPTGYDDKVDLVTLGLAQTSMCSIEIQKNAAAKLYSRGRLGSIRNSSFLRSRDSLTERKNIFGPSVLSFSSHLTPPSRIASNQVLVQIWAVALDGLDALLIQEKSKEISSAGFIPGRSFVGRAIEVGFGVTSISKGEWIYSLLDIQKVKTTVV
jgi:hypothetical protein